MSAANLVPHALATVPDLVDYPFTDKAGNFALIGSFHREGQRDQLLSARSAGTHHQQDHVHGLSNAANLPTDDQGAMALAFERRPVLPDRSVNPDIITFLVDERVIFQRPVLEIELGSKNLGYFLRVKACSQSYSGPKRTGPQERRE